ncbi:MAG TPA: hypothetical protein VFA09_06980 [Ktedonobacteraceae bacterium]|nr:hypothetical protein [Ktedonobacteraceae bacterium]
MNQHEIHSSRPDILEEGCLLWVLGLIVDGNNLPPLLCCICSAFTQSGGIVPFDTFWQSIGYLLDVDGDPWPLLQSFVPLLVG